MGKLSDKDKAYLLSLKPGDITFELLLDLFADKSQLDKDPKGLTGTRLKVIPCRIKTSDEFDLAANEYFNKEKVHTNAGQFIYNKLIVEKNLSGVLGYIDKPINSSVLGGIEDKLSKALLNDVITVDQMVEYLNTTQWLSMQFHSVLASSFTMKSLKPIPKVVQTRNKLIKENKDKLDKGDVDAAVKIEKQLLAIADEELKGDVGMNLYKSGARGSFGNNFKNISVMKGPVFNPVTGQFDVVTSNFMEGINKDEIPVYGNAIITGAYPKAIGTAVSGYFSKQIIAALQAVTLDKPGTDCGTKGYLTITIHPGNETDFLYRFVIENGKLVELTDSNIKSYVGKTVKMRSAMYCTGKKLCATCAGKMYHKLQIDNIGLTAARVSSTLLNLSMKKFHDSSAKINQVKINDLIL